MVTTRTIPFDLFDSVPHVMLCIKGADGRYIAANEAFVQRTSRSRVRDIVGRRAADLFPTDLAASYDAQDRSVLTTGRPIRNQLETISGRGGGRDWYLTTKVLDTGPDGPCLVVASIVAPFARGGPGRAAGLLAAVELVRREFSRRLDVAELSDVAGMSKDQLERAMRQVLGVSPKQYILRTRAEHAAYCLVTSDEPISHIAATCGYFDQSQMTRQFAALIGVTPGAYRQLR